MSQMVKNQFPTWTVVPGVLYTDCQHIALFPAIKTEKLETNLFLHARNICISQYALYIFSHFLGTGNGPQIPS